MTTIGYYYYYFFILCLLYNFPFVNSQEKCPLCPLYYCPATDSCVPLNPLPNQTCSCPWLINQCSCLLYKDSFNCSKSINNCLWIGCRCIPNTNPLCLSCPADHLNILTLGISVGVGVVLSLIMGCIFKLVSCPLKPGPRKRLLFHLIFNLFSLGSSGLVNYCTQVFIHTQYSSKISLLVCSSVECLFLILSWFSCIALPSQSGKLKRDSDLDSCQQRCVIRAYYIYYGTYLYCVGIWIFAYIELNSLLSGYLLWNVGLLLRLAPFALLLVERIGTCIYNCGAQVGGAVNPLFTHNNSYEELK